MLIMKKISLLILLFSAPLFGQVDKQMHFLAGASATAMTYEVVRSQELPKWTSIGASVVAGLAKEIYDEATYKGFDSKDWLATIAGGLTAYFTLELLNINGAGIVLSFGSLTTLIFIL